MARRNLKNLSLRAIACVDRPCQEHAKALVIKRAFTADERQRLEKIDEVVEFAKYICENDGAHSFQEVLSENIFNQNVWPCVDALSQSIRSIVGDSSLAGGERDAQINLSVQQFLQAVRDISPEVSKQLEPLLVKGDGQMPKSIEELQADVTKLEGQVSTLTKERDDAVKAKDTATAAQQTAEEECKTAKAALAEATEETIVYGGETIKRSEAGDGPFKAMKAMHAGEQTARLEKRAAEEFPHVVGTATEKALVLKTVNDLPEDNPTRKALESILKSAEKMSSVGFDRIGERGGDTPTVKAAQTTFKGKVSEIMKRDNIPEHSAMSKARSEFPTEFAEAYPEQAAAN